MLSVVIATQDSERTLPPTLAVLVRGATAGVVREVIIADAHSRDATGQIADGTGCRVIASALPLGARLKAAAEAARGPWLLFLQPGVILDSDWVIDAERFVEQCELRGSTNALAAVFRRGPDLGILSIGSELRALVARAFAKPRPMQGLLILRAFYLTLGGHRGEDGAEADLLARIGRRRIATLRTGAAQTLSP